MFADPNPGPGCSPGAREGLPSHDRNTNTDVLKYRKQETGMGYKAVDFSAVQQRHPDEVKAIALKMKARDPQELSWGYDYAVKINGSYSLANDLKGIERFRHSADSYVLRLVGKAGRKSESIELDCLDLAQDVNRCPQELFGVAKPEGHSLWLWEGEQVSAPGWNEVVALGGLTDGKTVVIRLARDTAQGRFDLIRKKPGSGWGGTMNDARGHLNEFGSRFGKVAGEWVYTGQLSGGTKTVQEAIDAGKLRLLSAEELEALIKKEFHDGYITCTALADEIRSQMSSLFGTQAPVEQTPASVWAQRIEKGRKWAWGMGLSAVDLEGYKALMAQTGPSSGNAAAVFGALFDPENQKRKEQARDIIKKIGMGQNPGQAYEDVVGEPLGKPKRAARP